jgi:hypothetical protein
MAMWVGMAVSLAVCGFNIAGRPPDLGGEYPR